MAGSRIFIYNINVMRRGLLTLILCALALCPAASARAQGAPQKPKSSGRHYQLAVYYEPGGNPKGNRYRVAAKKFSVDKKFKTEKLYSSLEILGSVLERDGRFMVDSWLQLEIATAPTGGEIAETTLIKTVYSLKPNKKTLVLKSPAMRVWMEMGADAGLPKTPGKKGTGKAAVRKPPAGRPTGGKK